MDLLPWGDTENTVSPEVQKKAIFRSRDLLRERSFWLIGISYFFISIAAYMISDFIVTYGVTELGVDYTDASALITLMALTGMAGGFFLMTASDHIGRRRSLMYIHFLLAVCILSILLARDNLSFVRVGMGGFGFIYGAIWPMYGVCTRDYFPKEVAGTTFGMMTIFYGIGAMVNPLLAGILTDLTGTFRWAFGVGVFASMAAGLVISFLGGPLQPMSGRISHPVMTE
jgi:sugar phosphate permease